MSYPPPNAKRPRELGTSAPAKRHVIDRRINRDVTALGLSTTDRTNRAIHTHVETATELWKVLVSAATEANQDKSSCPHKLLWMHLDPPLSNKSAAVKASVQALCLDLLLTSSASFEDAPQAKLSSRLVEWFALAREVAKGAHVLFCQGTDGWDNGIDPETNKPLLDEHAKPLVAKDLYWPFETYDRTLENPVYAHCFGDSASQCLRSRVRVVNPDGKAAAQWKAAEVAHRRMLDMEAHHELFRPKDVIGKEAGSGLTTEELGGLFLLTNVSDNWAKRTELFDLGFWMLRIVHFGLERNLGLRMGNFSLDIIGQSSPDASPQSPHPSEQSLRISFPDPLRSRCWLENVLHCIVALKVHLFVKLRWAVYDGPDNNESEKALAERVILDRHDIEQAKAHWLPSARPKSTPASPLGPNSKPVTDAAEPTLPPLAPLPPPANAMPFVPLSTLHTELLERVCEHGQPVKGLEALSMLARERFLVLKRIGELDRHVGMHLGVKRLIEKERRNQEKVAMETLASLTTRMEAPDLDMAASEQLAAEFDAISHRFTIEASTARTIATVKKRVKTHGIPLLSADRVWKIFANREVVIKLAAVGVPGASVTASNGHATLGPGEEFVALFGTTGQAGALSSTRCHPRTGYARIEALTLIDRLWNILKSEAALQRRLRSLSALVPVPLECHKEVALETNALGLSQRSLHPSLRRYVHLKKKQAERGTSLKTMSETCANSMSKAIECAFLTCLAECSHSDESDACTKEDESDDHSSDRLGTMPKMPARLYASQRKVASAVVHAFLNVAHLFNALHIVRDDDLPEDDDESQESRPPIMVYNATTGQLSMPHPKAIVERHWEAAQHLLDLATIIEPWVRDRRRRLGGLLRPECFMVTLSAEHGVCVHEERREVARERLDEIESSRQRRYWTTWPPVEDDLVTAERIETLVKWGRHATLHALKSATPRQGLPLEPYRGAQLQALRDAMSADRPHAWLYNVHAQLEAAAAPS
jgi:hypothetical protein